MIPRKSLIHREKYWKIIELNGKSSSHVLITTGWGPAPFSPRKIWQKIPNKKSSNLRCPVDAITGSRTSTPKIRLRVGLEAAALHFRLGRGHGGRPGLREALLAVARWTQGWPRQTPKLHPGKGWLIEAAKKSGLYMVLPWSLCDMTLFRTIRRVLKILAETGIVPPGAGGSLHPRRFFPELIWNGLHKP